MNLLNALKYIQYLVLVLYLTNITLLAEDSLKKKKGGNNSFLTKFEYAVSLYHNPRGLSCAECHGVFGRKIIKFPFQGMYFKNFKVKKRNRYIIFPPISDLTKKEFMIFFKKKKHVSFMPIYRLSDKEIELLYFYLKQVNNFKNPKKMKRID